MTSPREAGPAGPDDASCLHHVLHRGAIADPVLLLIHPLGADLTFWDPCIAAIDGRVSCLACDLRGVGSSPSASAPVTLAQHARDLEALRAKLGIARVVPVGCAIGSMVAVRYAVQYPDRVAGVALSNPALRTTETARRMLEERAARVRAGGMDSILPGAVDRAFLGQPRDERYTRYLERFAAQSAEGYALAALAVLDADISADLAALRCPTLVIAGAHDVLLPPEQARQVHALVPGAYFELFSEAAHFTPFQQPEAFATRILDFVRSATRPGASSNAIGAAAGAGLRA